MSYAILALGITEPPWTVEKINGIAWRARCESCGGHSRPYTRISLAREAQQRHADDHARAFQGEATAYYDTLRRPLEVVAVVARPAVA